MIVIVNVVGVSPPPDICDEALQRITNYRQRFEHHLQMTGHNTQGGFNPWKFAEKLVLSFMFNLRIRPHHVLCI